MGTGQSPTSWLEQWQSLWPLVLPVKEVEAILKLEEGEAWSKVADAIADVVGSSLLGQKMFIVPAREAIGQQVVDIIEKGIHDLASLLAVNESDVISSKNACKVSISKLANVQMLEERRKIMICYRGWQFPWKIRSFEEEVDLRFHVALRGWWAETSSIPLLPGEGELCAASKDLKVTKFDTSLTRAAERCRTYIKTVLKMQECSDGNSAEAA